MVSLWLVCQLCVDTETDEAQVEEEVEKSSWRKLLILSQITEMEERAGGNPTLTVLPNVT